MSAQPKEILETLLKLLSVEGQVTEHALDGEMLLDISTDDPERLIGRQGQTLADLQYVLNRLVFQMDSAAPKVTVDVGGYRHENREALIKKAREAAEKVRKWGDVVELEPLNAYERRIVHQAIKDDPGVETHSVEVEGTSKKAILLRPRR